MNKKNQPTNPANHIAVFQEKTTRRSWYENAWCFSTVDVCAVLICSTDFGAYWRRLKQWPDADGSEIVTSCHGLPDGKRHVADCANTEGLFHITQSIPSSHLEICHD